MASPKFAQILLPGAATQTAEPPQNAFLAIRNYKQPLLDGQQKVDRERNRRSIESLVEKTNLQDSMRDVRG